MADKRSATTHGIWTSANVVTCVRVVLVPVWVGLALGVGPAVSAEGDLGWWLGAAATLLYVLISLTDKLDGYLARSRGEVTNFGKFLDPIADKLAVVSALVVLQTWGLVSPWVAVIVVAREFLVSGLRMVLASEGVVVAAGDLGKWKTATTMVAIIALLLSVTVPSLIVALPLQLVGVFLMGVAVVLTIWSGADYFWKSRRALFADESFEGEGTADASAGEVGSDEEEQAPTWDDCVARATQVLDAARAAHVSVGTAESCTGGLVEAALTAVPGSSEVVKGAIGSYACSVKHAVLGVSDEVLDGVGPVSPECAEQMAEGACRALGCDLGVSVTGIAGPGGAEPGKPVGLVWFGSRDADGVRSESVVFQGDRAEVRLRAVMHALDLLLEACERVGDSR
ncbi:CDP-diacylglycerol--glycerol-3-phosphate 3-phosphatidyltransferase [uncultured Parolsenella sp.]|uniref:CDP-diacylglycerol--glycerol-3-phosphate 3-phosphatidyltransferase n=1 Tax=uncultured Parolsenella sp. TaxID=2083008 RepID=UPI0027D93832|nr:CDP-diacylglycerol--glycerol-3-phosphate 3-phosphatidyltransferase [uncultured Parolsenella sp.]